MRLVTEKDFDAVYDIYMDKTVYPFMAFDLDTKEEFKPIFEKMCARTYFWIFENETGPYGMCSILEDIGRASQSAYLGAFGIKSSMQGKGMGRKILESVESFLKEKEYKVMFFFVEADNQKAIPVYEKLGFKQSGSIPQYLKRRDENHYVDEILFTKILN